MQTAASARLVRAARVGDAIGADDLGRYLTPEQRALLVGLLVDDARAQADAIVAAAEERARAIVAEAQVQAEAIRRQAYAEGHAEGYAAGEAAGRQAMEPYAAVIQAASEEAQAIRAALLENVEQQVVTLALAIARKVVGEAVESQRGLAADLVRRTLRGAGPKVLRISVNPADVESVRAAVHDLGYNAPVAGNAAIAVGGCIIDVEQGMVDLRLDVQLATIERALTHPEV